MIQLLRNRCARLFLVLALCLAGSAVITGTFVLAKDGPGNADIYLSDGMKPGNLSTSDLGYDKGVATGVNGLAPGAASGMLRASSVLTAYLPLIFGSGNPSSGDTLADGGVVTGPDGVTIGAVSGTLTSTLAVNIAQTTAPTLTLPGGAQPHGNYYSISAERDLYPFGSSTFILGLPVPTGVMTDHLGIAIYEPADGEEPAHWFLLPGRYDAARNLMLVTLPHLATTPRTAVLVSHPALQSPLNNPAAATGLKAAATIGVSATGFQVLCVIADDFIRENCELEAVALEDELKTAMAKMTNMGYPEPALYTQAEAFNITNPTVLQSNTYVVSVNTESSGCGSEDSLILGFYRWRMQYLNYCFVPVTPFNDTTLYIIYHEFFHATQAAFSGVLADVFAGTREKWITEGTATVAEVSDEFGLKRSPWRDLRYVDRSLNSTENDDEYESQDFWVFLGQSSGSGLDRFITLFEQGATTEDVANWIGSMDGFKNWYWRWVKNQVMVEENITFDNQLGQPCTFQSQVVESLRTFKLSDGAYPGALPPLTSHVVELEIGPDQEGLSQIGMWVSNPNLFPDHDLHYKIYVEGETCTSVPDGDRILYDITATKNYYVVISNASLTDFKPYVIYWD